MVSEQLIQNSTNEHSLKPLPSTHPYPPQSQTFNYKIHLNLVRYPNDLS